MQLRIPGPTPLPDEVLEAMNRNMISHRGAEFHALMRDVTERPEAVESGWAELVGTSRNRIVQRATAWLANKTHSEAASRENPFGDGKASARIVQALQDCP